ncbi:protein kinase domain-containing protein [Enemella sp. A6]|uniref:serine/threonine-protein kinase n=1 Tax=Enemella sp. A6 TaxID=3440152 RepID=UPI003EBB653A
MDRIGRYRLTRRLGSGSFATVWLGHDDDLDVPVAVKILADNWAGNDDVRGRFLAEARLMRQVRDERIVRVYDIGTLDDQRPYFVMDYADSGSLEDLRKQGIQAKRAIQLCAEAGRALHVLHAHNVIHRDVTPGNILLTRRADGEMQVLLADLGVAKSMIDQVGQTMTAGTPAYMAREQATGVGVLDHRADIYSLAAVTYAMLTGRPPFPVRTLADLLALDPNQPPAPTAERVGAPPILDGLLLAALSPQPGRRPPSAEVMANALDDIARTMPGPDRTDPGGRPSTPAVPPDATVLRPSGPTPTSLIGAAQPAGAPVPAMSQAGAPQAGAVPQMGQPMAPVMPAGLAVPPGPSVPTGLQPDGGPALSPGSRAEYAPSPGSVTGQAAARQGLPLWVLIAGGVLLFIATMFITIWLL